MILGQAAITRLGVTELPLDHTKGMFNRGADGRLQMLDSLGDLPQLGILDGLDLAALLGNVEASTPFGFHALGCAAIAGIAINGALLAMQQASNLDRKSVV